MRQPFCQFVRRVLLVLLLCLAASGCVRRRLTIRTNPPGAQVYIDGYEIGTTPVSTSYIYYGTREITMVKSGYETLTVKQSFPPPWYQIPPLDFVSENLVPTEIRDERSLNFTLTPQILVPTDQLLGRAEQLRRGAQTQPGAPGLPTIPPPLVPPTGAQSLPPGGRAVPETVPSLPPTGPPRFSPLEGAPSLPPGQRPPGTSPLPPPGFQQPALPQTAPGSPPPRGAALPANPPAGSGGMLPPRRF